MSGLVPGIVGSGGGGVTWKGNLSTATQVHAPVATNALASSYYIKFSPDGTKAICVTAGSNSISFYTVSTSFDPRTLTLVRTVTVTSASAFYSGEIRGRYFYGVNNAGLIYRVDLGADWAIPAGTSIAFDQSFNTGVSSNDVYSICVAHDGSNIYIAPHTSGVVYRVQLATPHIINAGTTVTNADLGNTLLGLMISGDGKKFYHNTYSTSVLTEYDMITPYSLTVISQVRTRDLDDTRGWSMNDDGSRLYGKNVSDNTVVTYSLAA